LPVEQVRILDEPTAAALGYGMVEQENLLVIDFGVERWIYPLYGWMGRPSRQKTLGLFSNGEKLLAEKSAQKVKQRVLAK